MWNVHGLKTTVRWAVVKDEMRRIGLLILGISETHWNTNGEFTLGEGNFVFLSGKGDHTGVAIIIDGRYKHLVLGARALNDRMAVVRIDAAPSTISIIQAYAPKGTSLDEHCS